MEYRFFAIIPAAVFLASGCKSSVVRAREPAVSMKSSPIVGTWAVDYNKQTNHGWAIKDGMAVFKADGSFKLTGTAIGPAAALLEDTGTFKLVGKELRIFTQKSEAKNPEFAKVPDMKSGASFSTATQWQAYGPKDDVRTIRWIDKDTFEETLSDSMDKGKVVTFRRTCDCAVY